MMIKEISVSVGRTVNLGNYESLRVEVSATATIDTTDSEDQVREQLSQWLKQQARKTIQNQKNNGI